MVYQKLSDKYSDMEFVWRLARANQVRRERSRLIRAGVISPNGADHPNMMVKSGGSWVAQGVVF